MLFFWVAYSLSFPAGMYEIYMLIKVVCFSLVNLSLSEDNSWELRGRDFFFLSPLGCWLGRNPCLWDSQKDSLISLLHHGQVLKHGYKPESCLKLQTTAAKSPDADRISKSFRSEVFFFFLDLNVIFSDHHYLFKCVKTTLKAVVTVEKKISHKESFLRKRNPISWVHGNSHLLKNISRVAP